MAKTNVSTSKLTEKNSKSKKIAQAQQTLLDTSSPIIRDVNASSVFGVLQSQSLNSKPTSNQNFSNEKVVRETDKTFNNLRRFSQDNFDNLDESGTDLGIESVTRFVFDPLSSFPRISGVKIKRESNFNVLKWKVDSNSENVDHFRIYAQADGIKCEIGRSQPHVKDENSYYSFFIDDQNLFDRLGKVDYFVTAITLEYLEVSDPSWFASLTVTSILA